MRNALIGDLPRLRMLHQQLYPEYDITDERVAEANWRAIEETPGRSIYVAELGSLIVGTADIAVLANLAHRGEPYLLVENVVVDRAYRRQGIGGALLDAAYEHARSAGCYKLYLSAADPDAFAFYEAAGWQHTARTYKRYVGR